MKFSSYFTAYHRLLSLANLETVKTYASQAAATLALKNVSTLLHYLGDPQKQLKFVHITGTSGKGSVTRLMHEILWRAGSKVGSYSSPHTTTYLERYRINGKLADPNKLAQAMNQVLTAYQTYLEDGHAPLNFFALNTCIAMTLFQQAKLPWCVLEVGMGGRLDSTNVIPSPVVAVITNIDLDHTQFLGPTKIHIAHEKAGIIKPGCHVITGETDPGSLDVIQTATKQQQAPLTVIANTTHNHLQHNADICRAAAQLLHIDPKITEDVIATTPSLPCRLEVIQKQPRVIIDGAHNLAKIKATVASIKRQSKTNVQVIFGCKDSKDAAGMAKALAQIARTVTTTRSTDTVKKSANPVTLLKLFPSKQRGQAYLFPHDALAACLKQAKKSDTILVTGSLYLAGELRTLWRTEAQILIEQES